MLLLLCGTVATTRAIRNIVSTNTRLERITRDAALHHRWELLQTKRLAAHQRKLRATFAVQQSSPSLPVAAITTPDGVSDKVFPTVRAFCEAMRAEGLAAQKNSGKFLADKVDAIDASFGAQLVSAGDIVEVVRDGRTTCDGEFHRMPANISFVRDYRVAAAGWILSAHLTDE